VEELRSTLARYDRLLATEQPGDLGDGDRAS
jgi:hypothetical protein